MSWNAGEDLAVGTVVTATKWNSYLGTAGSIEYLKVETDKLNTVSMTEPSRALNTVYQNTGGKIRVETVTVLVGDTNPSSVNFFVGVSTAGLEGVGSIRQLSTIYIRAPLTMIVPPNYYCKASVVEGAATLILWKYWDLH